MADPRLSMGCGERDKGQNPRPFYGCGQGSLVQGTITRDPARNDLASFRNEQTQEFRIFIIQKKIFIGAKPA